MRTSWWGGWLWGAVLFSLAVVVPVRAAELEVADVVCSPAPVQPTVIPTCNTSVLLGRSPFQVPAASLKGWRYAPIEGGGFRLLEGRQRVEFNRPIAEGRNIIVTGDSPLFNLTTLTGMGVYDHAADKCFPLLGAENELQSQAKPDLGTLALGVVGDSGQIRWLHEAHDCESRFRPGYSEYRITDAGLGCRLTMLPLKEFCGFVCKVEFDTPRRLVWKFGGLAMERGKSPHPANRIAVGEKYVTLTSADMPKLKMLLASNPSGKVTVKDYGGVPYAESAALAPARTFYILNAWGVDSFDKALAEKMMGRLDGANSALWQAEADRLKKMWFDCYIGAALQPAENMQKLLENPAKYFAASKAHWDRRMAEFAVDTPDKYLNSIVEFQRATSDYHVKGPGLLLGDGHWFMYSHISVGWFGRMWGGDIESIKNYMRLFACLQRDDGYINWISPSLAAYSAENNTPYWVEHVWWVYQWSGDTKFLQDMWPAVQRAVAYENSANDPDGDGLYKAPYIYWNCDSDGQGPSVATATAVAWSINDKVARIAAVLGDSALQQKYAAKAAKIRKAALEQLWDDKIGVLGSIGADGIWRSHPQVWSQYLPIIYGLLPPEKGARAMRWLEAHYGFNPAAGVNLLMSCDWWPLRWSVHWVPTGDSLLAAQAGLMCGDADLWWPYIRTVAAATFKATYPQIGFSMNNNGVAGGETDLIDAVDPHTHMVLRGMFGITPDVPDNTFYIKPSFPSWWRDAAIRTPQISYKFHREGSACTLSIESPEPTVKIVTPYPESAQTITTPRERESVVKFELPVRRILTAAENVASQVLVEDMPRPQLPVIASNDLERCVMLDLSRVYNTTLEELTTKTQFVSDLGDRTTIQGWWHTIPGRTGRGAEVLTGPDGVRFLLKGRNAAAEGKANNLLAVSSWGAPGGGCPLPGRVTIPVGRKVEKIWMLLQSYVSPIKNYIPNGEIRLHYADGSTKLVQLIPPYNLDTYYQAFARKGASLELGELIASEGWSPCKPEFLGANALELPLECDAAKVLKSIEVSGTVSEGVIGITAVTLLVAP